MLSFRFLTFSFFTFWKAGKSAKPADFLSHTGNSRSTCNPNTSYSRGPECKRLQAPNRYERDVRKVLVSWSLQGVVGALGTEEEARERTPAQIQQLHLCGAFDSEKREIWYMSLEGGIS